MQILESSPAVACLRRYNYQRTWIEGHKNLLLFRNALKPDGGKAMEFILGYSMTTQNHKTMTRYACIYIQNKASKLQYIDWRDYNSRAFEDLQKHVE